MNDDHDVQERAPGRQSQPTDAVNPYRGSVVLLFADESGPVVADAVAAGATRLERPKLHAAVARWGLDTGGAR